MQKIADGEPALSGRRRARWSSAETGAEKQVGSAGRSRSCHERNDVHSEAEFQNELEVFRHEEEAAQQYFFAWLMLNTLPSVDNVLLERLNDTSLFWITTRHALLLASFVALGRIFDQSSRHNIDRLLKCATDCATIFSRTALFERKRHNLSETQAREYVSDTFEPTADDFRSLRAEVNKRRKIYVANYRDVRDKLFAHKELSNSEDISALYSKTNVDELKRLFVFLHDLHEALWELFHNGRKPELVDRPFVLPPGTATPWTSRSPGERIAWEAAGLFAGLTSDSKV